MTNQKKTNPPILSEAELDAIPPGQAIWSLSGDEAKEYYDGVIVPNLMDGSLRSVGQFHFKKGEEPAGYFITPKADSGGKYYHWLPFDSPDEAGAALMDWLVNGKPPCDNLVDTHGESSDETNERVKLIALTPNQVKQADLERNIVVAAYNFRKTDCPSGALLIAMDALDKHLHTVALPNPKGREQIE